MNEESGVLFEEISGTGGAIGLITLNRPQVLNSLNHAMIRAMTAQLKIWAKASTIKAVVIKAAEGRAFCAGGDLRSTYERYQKKDISLSQFFYEEYHLNRCIFHFPKPYIALLDGITMGGGVGISIHGSHRIATERLVFAMPETGIGFFPDVGGTYFLPRLPCKLGFYLGLVSAKLSSDDCIRMGIVTHKVAHDAIPQLIQALTKHPFHDHAHAAVTAILEPFQTKVESSQFIEQQAEIEACFFKPTMEDIFLSVQKAQHSLCQAAALSIPKKSPTSLKVTLRALQGGEQLDFDQCMKQEFRLACRFLQGHDFVEGIRAVIIDKDQVPQWDPPTLSLVKEKNVEAYFLPLVEELI